MAYPLPEKPSIAVLAFDNMTGDPNLEYFSDGIAEEIITVLSMVNGLFVIARNSSFSYKGKPVNIQNVSEELGVRYVLEGSVRKSDGKVRVSAQLLDAVKGQHLWAESYDRDFNNILKLQDEISMKVVSSLQVNLTEGEQRRILSNYMNPEIFKKHVQAQSHMRKGTREGLERYGELAKEIVALAPESRIGYRLLGWYHSGLYGLGENREQNLKKAFGFAQKALSIDENDAFSLSLMCDLYLQMKEWDKSIASGQRSVELQPSSSQLHSVLGTSLCFAERYDEGITHCEKAIRLNPYPAYFDFLTLARCYFAKGRYEDAIIELKKSLKLSPNFAITHFWLAINYSLLNRDEEARMAAKKTLEIAPIISISLAPKFWRFKTEDGLKVVIDAMRKAGFPKYPPGKG